jgi:hypothetical protein
MARTRGDKGKFIQKSSEPRLVRSIRATNSTWDKLGRIAHERCITRADLIEYFVSNHVLHEEPQKENDGFEQERKTLQCELPLAPKPCVILKEENSLESYSERAFAKKIGINRSSLTNQKKKYLDGLISDDDFQAYLCEHDPQSRPWRYCRERKRYYY